MRSNRPHGCRSLTLALATVVLAMSLWPALAGSAVAPPKTTILSGPSGDTDVASPQFTFSADQPSQFACSVDGAAFAPCSSPDTVGPLALGKHSFSVRATNSAGESDPSPPARTWTIVSAQAVAPPTITLRQPVRLTLRAAKLSVISGTASAATGVTGVQIALGRGGPQRQYFPPRCRYVDLHSGRKLLQACLLPAYADAAGTTTWRFVVRPRVRRRLAAGDYTLTVRALNSYGQATEQKYNLTLR